MFETHVAKTIGFTTFRKNVARASGLRTFQTNQLLKDLTVDTSENNVAKTNDCAILF